MDVASGRAQLISLRISGEQMSVQDLARIVWAPSQHIMAVDRCSVCSPVSGLDDTTFVCLVEPSGRVTKVAPQSYIPATDVPAPGWSANSKHLAVRATDALILYDLDTQKQYTTGVPMHSRTVWSPISWATPLLLSVTTQALNGMQAVQFLDATGKIMGSHKASFPRMSAEPLVWGQHGVAVLGKGIVWLCAVLDSALSLVLEVKHFLKIADLERPVLSPDEVHLCLCQVTASGSSLLCDLVLVDLLSGCHALIEQPEPMSAPPSCSWSKHGYACSCHCSSRRQLLQNFQLCVLAVSPVLGNHVAVHTGVASLMPLGQVAGGLLYSR